MSQLKLVTWNVEWMNNLFSNNAPKQDVESQTRLGQISSVISDLAPDILVILEGPNDIAEMQSFVNDFLGGSYIFVRGSLRERHPVADRAYADTQMNWILYRKNGNLSHMPIQNTEKIGPFKDWKTTIHPAIGEETFFHHRLPVEIDLTFNDGNVTLEPIKIFGLHPKSKKASDAPGSAAENRRILLAQAINIRDYIDSILDNEPDKPIVICGDMNDGIGLDPFEYHLGGDFASIITGTVRKPHQLFTNACAVQIVENIENPGKNYTLQFSKGGKIRKLIIDHLMFSPRFKSDSVSLDTNSGRIRNDILITYPESSDHAPVEATITLF